MKLHFVFAVLFCLSVIVLGSAAPLAVYADSGGGEARTVRVAFQSDQAPYQFLDANGVPAGINIEIFNYIAKRNGLKPEYLPSGRFEDCISALTSGEADVILGVINNRSYSQNIWLTSETLSSSVCMIVPNELSAKNGSLQADNYTAVLQYSMLNSYQLPNLGKVKFQIVGNPKRMVDALTEGEAQIAIGDKNCLDYQLNALGVSSRYYIYRDHIDTISYCMAVAEDDFSMNYLLNNELALMKSEGIYESIRSSWIEDSSESSRKLKRLSRIIAAAAIALSAAAVVYTFVNNRIRKLLKKEIDEKTKDLHDINLELEKQVLMLRDESDLVNRIVKYSPAGMILFDRDFKIDLINNSGKEILNAGDDALGQSIFDFELLRPVIEPFRDRIFDNDQLIINKVMSFGYGSNQKSFRYSVHRIFQFGAPSGALVMIEDITKEEKEKQELINREKQTVLSRIVAGIAHEIKNPLMSIRMYAQMVGSMGNDEEFMKSFSEFVPRETDRINSLIENLINYAKPSVPHVTVFDAAELIRDCLYLTGSMKKHIQTEFICDGDKGPLLIRADRTQLQQVVVNVIVNALESMDEKLKQSPKENEECLLLSVSLTEADGTVLMSFTDQGEGMTPEQIKDCTEPFYTTKENGTGLGLALSKQLIEENNGYLQIESEPGKYTRISLCFKLEGAS